jgi:hypothetical protein
VSELFPVRFSQLKLMALSAAHYRCGTVSQTPSMEQGSATDAVILGTKRAVAYPGKQRRGKAWEEFKAEHDGELLLTKKQLAVAESMRDAVAENKHAMRVLTGKRQAEISWEWLGRECVSHLDVLGEDFITDLKVSVTSCPGRFKHKALKMAYHAQLAFYRLAARSIGRTVRNCYIVAAEPVAPYVPTVFRLTEAALEAGERMCRLWFEQLLTCESSNEWPGYSQTIVDLDVEEDLDLDFGEAQEIDFNLNECVAVEHLSADATEGSDS